MNVNWENTFQTKSSDYQFTPPKILTIKSQL